MKKRLSVVLAAAAMTLLTAFNAFAGTWHQDNVGWWYENDDGSYLQGGFAQVDGVWYYFDGSGYMQTGWVQGKDGNWYYMHDVDGYMLTSTMTPDGYWVDENGVWDGSESSQGTAIGSVENNTMIATVNGLTQKFYAEAEGSYIHFKFFDEERAKNRAYGERDMEIVVKFDKELMEDAYYQAEDNDDVIRSMRVEGRHFKDQGLSREYKLGDDSSYELTLTGSGNTWSGVLQATLESTSRNNNTTLEIQDAVFCFTFGEVHPYYAEKTQIQEEFDKETDRLLGQDGGSSYGSSYSGSSSSSSGSSGSSSSRTCTFCRGNGLCHVCDGKGYTYTTMFGMSYHKCTICNGRMICTHCSGTGRK